MAGTATGRPEKKTRFSRGNGAFRVSCKTSRDVLERIFGGAPVHIMGGKADETSVFCDPNFKVPHKTPPGPGKASAVAESTVLAACCNCHAFVQN